MRATRLSRHVVVATLAASLTAILLGCQHLATTPATAPAPVEPTLYFAALQAPKTTFVSAAFMPAAVANGEFEAAFKPAPAPTPAPVVEPQPVIEPQPVAEGEPEQEAASVGAKMLVYESGIASTYGMGDGFEGERTGCGSIFRTQVVQVAHKSLPCGTIVRIEDTDTGKYVDAEVTDRGPYVAGRIVDLSYAAFTQLDPVGTGLLNVNVYVIDTSNQYRYRLR